MTYVDLGQYTFTTGQDLTGFNVGNLTSILDPAAIRIPNYELYRLLINTSAVPAPSGLPAVVQVSPFAAGASATVLDISFASPTTPGNTIIAGVGSTSVGGTDPAVSGITLGASADNWGAVVSAGNSDTGTVTLWADPGTAEASKALVVTLHNGTTGPYAVQGLAYELSGMFTTTTAADTADTTGLVNTTSPTAAPATTNNPTTVANDLQIGFGTAIENSTFTLAGPAAWNSALIGPSSPAAGSFIGSAAAWNLASAKGSPGLYAPTSGSPAFWAAVTAAFLPSATAPTAQAFPFTVATDGVTWDSETTVAGVGYTYSLGQSPLYLRTGQTLQIFWQLPAAMYASYSQLFNITGWFRYDPSVQP